MELLKMDVTRCGKKAYLDVDGCDNTVADDLDSAVFQIMIEPIKLTFSLQVIH
jgi:hypothetical protein